MDETPTFVVVGGRDNVDETVGEARGELMVVIEDAIDNDVKGGVCVVVGINEIVVVGSSKGEVVVENPGSPENVISGANG